MIKVLKGYKKGITLGIAYFPFAFTLGIMAKNYGVRALDIFLMTVILYAGSSQVIILKLLFETSSSVLQIIITAILVNLRYLLICVPIIKKQKDYNFKIKLLSSIILTDESIGYLLIKKIYDPYISFGFNLAGYTFFCIVTLLGALFAKYIPVEYANSLNFLLYAIFLSLLTSAVIQNNKYIIIVVLTIVLKLIFMYLNLPVYMIMLLSVIIASLVYSVIKESRVANN